MEAIMDKVLKNLYVKIFCATILVWVIGVTLYSPFSDNTFTDWSISDFLVYETLLVMGGYNLGKLIGSITDDLNKRVK